MNRSKNAILKVNELHFEYILFFFVQKMSERIFLCFFSAETKIFVQELADAIELKAFSWYLYSLLNPQELLELKSFVDLSYIVGPVSEINRRVL